MHKTNAERWEAAEEGGELVRDGEFDAAITYLLGVVEKDSENEYAYNFLGSAYFEKGEFPQALKAYLTAVELVPDYLGAMVNMGHALRMLARYDEAIRVGKQAILKNPDDGDAHYMMGLCYFAQGNQHYAMLHLQKTLAAQPEAELALEVQGMIQVLKGEVVPMAPEDTQDDD